MHFDEEFFKELLKEVPDLPEQEKMRRLFVERSDEIFSACGNKDDTLLFFFCDDPKLTKERGKEIADHLSKKLEEKNIPLIVTCSIGISDVFFFHKTFK